MEIILDNIASDGCFSIRKLTQNGYEWRAFCLGQWDELEEYIPNYKTQYSKIEDLINKLWTPSAISAWQQEQAEQENLLFKNI